MILTKREVEVMECLRQGMSYAQAAEHLHVSRTAIKSNLSRLVIAGAMQRVEKGRYKFLVKSGDCDIVQSHPRGLKPSLGTPTSPTPVEDANRSFIRSNYGKMKRREIAKQLKMNKYDLNLLIIDMGISKG